MTERRFYKFVGNIEFEITDPISVRAAEMGVSHDGESIGLIDGEPVEHVAARLFTMLMDREALERAGMKWTGGGLFPRFTSEDGATYTAMSLPEEPVRRDDGTFPGVD